MLSLLFAILNFIGNPIIAYLIFFTNATGENSFIVFLLIWLFVSTALHPRLRNMVMVTLQAVFSFASLAGSGWGAVVTAIASFIALVLLAVFIGVFVVALLVVLWIHSIMILVENYQAYINRHHDDGHGPI